MLEERKEASRKVQGVEKGVEFMRGTQGDEGSLICMTGVLTRRAEHIVLRVLSLLAVVQPSRLF